MNQNAEGPEPATDSPPVRVSGEAMPVSVLGKPPAPDTPPKVDPWAHRRGEPRPLALAWTIFLALATILCLASLAARGATSYESYRPAARSLLAVVAVGLCVLWPMVRLSQSSGKGPVWAWVWKDLVVLLMPAQAVIWPQAFFFLAKWPIDVVAAVAAMLSAWAVLTGAVLATGWRVIDSEGSGAARRGRVMLVLVGVVALGPLISWPVRIRGRVGSPEFDGWAMTSPITGVFELTRDRLWTGRSAEIVAAHWWAIAVVSAVGIVSWIVVGLVPRRPTPR